MSTARRFGGAGIRRGLRSCGAAADWDPTQLTGVAEWWRADLGVTDAGGGAVSAWEGQIAGETMTQATAGNRPAIATRDGQTALSFASDYIAGTFSTVAPSQPTTVVLVIEQTSLALDLMFDGAGASNRHFFYSNTGANYVMGSATGIAVGGTPDTDPHAIVCTFDSPNSLVYIDDLSTPLATSAATGTEDLTGLTIGAAYTGGNGIDGFVWEAIVIDQAIAADDRAALGAYLDARYPSLTLTF